MHKTDVGGVLLGVEADGARDAFDQLAAVILDETAGAGSPPEAPAVLISPMVGGDVELLVGAVRDPQLGPVLTVGSGGAWVEIMADTVTRVAPVTAAEVEEMLGELRIAPLLRGARGRPPVAADAIVKAALAVARCLEEIAEITEVEVNPLAASADRAVALDARVLLSTPVE